MYFGCPNVDEFIAHFSMRHVHGLASPRQPVNRFRGIKILALELGEFETGALKLLVFVWRSSAQEVKPGSRFPSCADNRLVL